MTLSMTWNSTALPLPAADGLQVVEPLIGGHDRMITGLLRQQVIARKTRIESTWHGLLVAEWTVVRNAYLANYNTATTLVIPDSRSWTVLCVSGWPEDNIVYSRAGIAYYKVKLVFEEQ